MRPLPSLLSKIWRKLRGKAERPKTVRPRQSKVMPTLEPLEGRIAPATLISPTTVMFSDIDGDIVTVKFNKPLFDLATDVSRLASANAVLKFSAGMVDTVSKTFTPSNPGQQLQLIDLLAARSVNNVNVATGTTITVSVVKGASGDGFTNVGYIHAFEAAGTNSAARGVNLGAVTIAGDLGQIDAGTLSAPAGLASLKVKSLGVADPATTQPAVNATTLASSRTTVSNIFGALGPVTIADDLRGTLRAQNNNQFFGTMNGITISGSLRGGAAEDSGSIISDANIGAIVIGNTLDEGIFGGAGENSGTIRAGGAFPGRITSLTVSGDIDAGVGPGSGVVSAKTSIGAVKIGRDIDAVTAGATVGAGAGGVISEGTIASVTIVGALKGGETALTGFVTSGSDIGAIKAAAIAGNKGTNSGSISSGGKIASLTVTTNIMAGDGFGSASITSGTDLDRVGDIGAIKIGGKLQGGLTQNSGSISSGGKIVSVTIGPAVVVDQTVLGGGTSQLSGSIFSRGAIGSVKINGNVQGGDGAFSGAIVSRDYLSGDFDRAGTLGAVTVIGTVKGGVGNDSGEIRADGKITSVTIGKTGASVDSLAAGAGLRSGSIYAGQGIVEPGTTGAIKINGSVANVGGGAQGGGIFSEGKIASVTITKALNGGTIRAGDDIVAITVGGDVTNANISARGQAVQTATDLAIGKITVTGNVSGTSIRAGYDTQFTNAVNADAQIGPVIVKGNWTASNLIAGVIDVGANGFGNADDARITGGFDNAKIVSQIASIVINGVVGGTASPTNDHFGFVAQKIGAMKISGVVVPFSAVVAQSFPLASTGASPTNDVTAREVAVPVS